LGSFAQDATRLKAVTKVIEIRDWIMPIPSSALKIVQGAGPSTENYRRVESEFIYIECRFSAKKTLFR
jgi:hypothetical protein